MSFLFQFVAEGKSMVASISTNTGRQQICFQKDEVVTSLCTTKQKRIYVLGIVSRSVFSKKEEGGKKTDD